MNPANWHLFLPFGLGGILAGASIIFFAYIGFDQISTSAEEARQSSRDLPLDRLRRNRDCLRYILGDDD